MLFDSCFVPFKLDYSGTKKHAAGDFVSSEANAGGHLWKIRCYPCGEKVADNKGDYLSIFLELMSKSDGRMKAIFEAFVMDKDGAPSFSHAQRFLHVYPLEDSEEAWGWRKFVKRSVLDSLYVVNGVVTIICGVVVLRDDGPLTVPPSDIGSHLGRLLDCTDGSDVSFVVDGKTFPAHRAVLAARSPVFKAELFGSMAEATMSHITLEEIEPATFEVFLRFVYTDTLLGDDELGDSPVKMYRQLLAAADRYAMDRLKVLCTRKLWDKVSVDTAADTLACAEAYNCSELKKKCIAFFAEEKNFRKTVLTDGFVRLVQKFPSIITELRDKVEK